MPQPARPRARARACSPRNGRRCGGWAWTARRPSLALAATDPERYARALCQASVNAELMDADGLGGFGWLVQAVGTSLPAPLARSPPRHSGSALMARPQATGGRDCGRCRQRQFRHRWRQRNMLCAGRLRSRGSMGGCASATPPGHPGRGRQVAAVTGAWLPGTAPAGPGTELAGGRAGRPGRRAGRSFSSTWGPPIRRHTGCSGSGSPWTATGSRRPNRRSGSCTAARRSCSRRATTARSSCSPTGMTGWAPSPANWAWCSPPSGWPGSRCRPGPSGPARC